MINKIDHIKKITQFRDIDEVLFFLAQGVKGIFGDGLVGLYLTGSLSYGDFEEGRSDIDLAVVLKKPATPKQIAAIKQLHLETEKKFPKWGKRIECSYVPLGMLKETLPPKAPRPYVGNGIFHPQELYGNEWFINKFLLRKYGIALIGPDFKTLALPVKMTDVQKAHIRDLHKEWEPKICDATYLENSHQQSYLVLNLCRILYNLMGGRIETKKGASLWVKAEFPQWKNLIETATNWRYGIKMERQKEVIEFIKFVLEKADCLNLI